jgi:hypothetical protein
MLQLGNGIGKHQLPDLYYLFFRVVVISQTS